MAESLPTEISASESTRRASSPEQLQDLLHVAKHTSTPIETSKETPLVHLLDGEAQAFRHLAHSIVSRTLAHESEFRRTKSPELGHQSWKLLKRQNDLSIYKRRMSKQTEQTRSSARPMVLCVGSITGQLEDVLYGIHAKNRDEMQVILPYMSKGFVDCALLAKLEAGSALDPYRQLSLKWQITDTLTEAKIMKHRDLCTLESMGVRSDGQGEKYAYYLLQSVDFAGCPPPAKNSDVIRANMTFCCIYRQVPGSRMVNVYAKGMFDLGGDVPAFLVYNSSSALMLSILGAIDGAESKRLTLLALKKAKKAVMSSADDLSTLDMEEFEFTGGSMPSSYSNSASSLSAEVTSAFSSIQPGLARLLSKGYRKSRSRRQSAADRCCVCTRKPALATIVGATHRTCGVCQRGVCIKCHVKRRLLCRLQSVTVACCKSCLLEAKQLVVDPRDPCPMLP